MTTSVSHLTLDQFLALPETKPYQEYVHGEVCPKATPTPPHSRLVFRLAMRLGVYLEQSREGYGDTELRHVSLEEGRVYLPDVEVTLRSRFPPGHSTGPIPVHPDIAIEVISPDDFASRVLDKVAFYLRIGVRLTWLVDPEQRTVTVYRHDLAPLTLTAAETLGATPVLKNFRLPLADLFSALDDE